MAAKSNKNSDLSLDYHTEILKRFDLTLGEMGQILARLDAMTNLMLDFLLSDPRYEKSVAYTDKVARLHELGVQLDTISGIVGRPSNYVSSRLRESKKRKFSKRQKKVAKVQDSNQ